MTELATATHNLTSIAEVLPLDLVQANIAAEIDLLTPRRDELLASCKRFVEAHPKITDDEKDAQAAQVLAAVQRFVSKTGVVETTRVALKAPVLAADTAIGSLVKGPFADLIKDLDQVSRSISKASVEYKVAKEKRERDARAAEAERLAREAREAEERAAKGRAAVDWETVSALYADAERAQEAVNAAPAELTRARGELVGTTSLRMKPDLEAIKKAAGNAGDPIPVIPGVEITDVRMVSVKTPSLVPQEFLMPDLNVRR